MSAYSRTSTTPSIDRLGRSIHALDYENLLGGTEASEAEIVNCYSAWLEQVGIRPGDRVIVSSSHRLAKRSWFLLPLHGIQRLVRSGIDGADLALLDAIDIAHDSSRFANLVIGSGDGIYEQLALSAVAHGMSVRQVIGKGRPSWRLQAVVASTQYLSFDGRPSTASPTSLLFTHHLAA